jgi:hypothetical protein
LVQLVWDQQEQQQVAWVLLASCQQSAPGMRWAQHLLHLQWACWVAPQLLLVRTRLVAWAQALLLKAWVQPRLLLLQELSQQQGPKCLTPW